MNGSWKLLTTASMAVLAWTSLGGAAAAAPAQLTRAQFTQAVAGKARLVETFEGFADGPHAAPLALANALYSAPQPFTFTTVTLNRVLLDGVDVASDRTFSAFPAGTRFWAADIAVDEKAVLRVTVTGATGTTIVDVRGKDLRGFLAFSDPVGLSSVSLVNLGNGGKGQHGSSTGNYGFDNITTASDDPAAAPAPVPGDFLNQSIRATFVPAADAPGAQGQIEARSDVTRVVLAVQAKGLPTGRYELVVNDIVVAYFFSETNANGAVTFATDAPPLGALVLPLQFDPFVSRYAIARDGAVLLQTTLGGVPVDGGLAPIR